MITDEVQRSATEAQRTITTAARSIEITAPRMNDRRIEEASGERVGGFKSVIGLAK